MEVYPIVNLRKPDSLLSLEYLIKNSYFEIDYLTLVQSIGIPMGIDTAPF